jgi:uncharacterized protein (TIGR03083 family)
VGSTWKLIEIERTRLAEALGGLTAQEWHKPSLVDGWDNHLTLAHVVGSAQVNFRKAVVGLVSHGFSFSKMVADLNQQTAKVSSPELVAKLRELSTARDRPPGPIAAQLLEVVVHGEDIVFPLGRKVEHDHVALIAAAEYAKHEQTFVGVRKRIAGLRARATDFDWSTGAGPEVSGPMVALLLAICGRKAALDELTGDGVEILRSR